MSKKFIVFFVLIVIITAPLINSCRKSDLNSEINRVDEKFSVADAKEWFYGTFAKTDEYKSQNERNTSSIQTFTVNGNAQLGNKTIQKHPVWSKAGAKDKKGYSVVEMPYLANERYYKVKNNVHSDYERRILAHYTLTNVIFIKSNTGKITPRLVHITPDSDYLRKEHFDIHQNSFSKIDPNFSGWVQVQKWNGETVREFYLKKGKVKLAFAVNGNKESKSQSVATMSQQTMAAGGEMCTIYVCYKVVSEIGDQPFTCAGPDDCPSGSYVEMQVPCPEETPLPIPDEPSDTDPNNPDPNNPIINPPPPPPPPNDGGWDPAYGGGDPGDPPPFNDPFDPGDPSSPGDPFGGMCWLIGCFDPPPSIARYPYALTSVDQKILSDLRQIKEEAQQLETAKTTCHGTLRIPGSTVFQLNAVLAHLLIQDDYILSNSGSFAEYFIPNSSLTGTNPGYVDIANKFTGELFEIKSTNPVQIALGQAEIIRYTAKALTGCPNYPIWHPGMNYSTKYLPNPTNPTQSIKATLHSPGLITYDFVSRVSNPVPVFMPQSIIDIIKDLIQRRREYPSQDFTELALSRLRDIKTINPQLIVDFKNAIHFIAAGIITAYIIEAILTEGIGLFANYELFEVAKDLEYVAFFVN